MSRRINVTDFDLAATLECGQAFRWSLQPDGWYEGVVGRQVWRIRQTGNVLEWEPMPPLPSSQTTQRRPLPQGLRQNDSPLRSRVSQVRETPQSCTAKVQGEGQSFIEYYLTLDADLPSIVATFPKDKLLEQAVKKYWGLRLTRQEPWETLASFIASSTKQIVQIRQIVVNLARRFGEPISPTHYTFPNPDVIARAELRELLACKLGFRAKYIQAAARAVDAGTLDLSSLRKMEYERALEELMKLPGVGEKIGNCVLLFSCEHENAFPIDVWVRRALERLYRHPVTPQYFGPYAGWANQYLFHAERTQ